MLWNEGSGKLDNFNKPSSVKVFLKKALQSLMGRGVRGEVYLEKYTSLYKYSNYCVD